MRELSELESDSESTNNINANYKSNFGRSVASLFKKSFLIKIRRPAAIIEIILALIIWIVIYPCWLLARDTNKGYPDPVLYPTNLIPYRLVAFFAITRNSTFVIAPDCNNTRVLASMINFTINTAIDLFFLSQNSNISDINNTDDWIFDIIDQLYPDFNDWLNQTLNGTIGPNISFSDINFTDLFLNFTNSNNITLDDILSNLFNRTLLPTPNPAVLLEYDDEFESEIDQKSIQKLINSEFVDFIKASFIEGLKEYFNDYSDDTNLQNIRNFLKEYLIDKINDYLFSLSKRYRQSILNFDKVDESNSKNNRKILSKKINSLYEMKNKRKVDPNLNQTNYNSKRKIIAADDDNFGGVNDDDTTDDNTNEDIPDYGQYVNLTEIRSQFEFEPVFVDTVEEMTDKIYEHTSNGVGVYWANAEDNETALRSPIIQTYSQVFFSTPDRDLLEIIYRSIAIMSGYPEALLSITNTSYQFFATPETEELFDLSILIGIIAIFPVIISTMPDMQSLLEEKDTRVQTLSFLMGCTETAYFFVEFCMCFIVSIFPYLFMCLFLCYGFVMVGTSFSLMFVLSVLFIIAHICFLMFITTFMKKASMGRIITVVFLVLTVFFSYIHYFYTLDESNHEEVVKHIFSIIPLSCYQMVMMTMYTRSRTSLPPVDWTMLKNGKEVDFVYPIWYSLLWLPIDIIVYFLLFLLFNLTNSRDFGSPLISWKELFHKEAWQRLFKKDYSRYRKSSVSGINQESLNQLMRVENLSKTYKGYKDVKALTDVNFTIYQNEVIVVIGPNGAGKSTLINILAGAIEPTSGTLYLYGGEPTNRFIEIQKFLGVCFQENVIIDLLSIKEHFDLFGSFKNIPKQELEETMNFFAETLQLTDMLKTRAGDLSGGQKRKLCISLSLLGNPPLVIMDEPTAGVDVQARQLIWKVIASLKHTTTIVTSHALEEAEAVSTRLFVVAGGKVPFAGTSTEFRKQFQCGYILRIDTSKMNQEEEEESNNEREEKIMKNKNNKNIVNNLSNDSSNHSNASENNNNNNNNDVSDELALNSNEESTSLESNYLDYDEDDALPFNVEGEKKEQKVVDPEVMAKVFQLAKKYEDQSKMSEDRDDTILMPVSKNIPKFINKLEEMKKKLGVTSFSFSVEQLEDVLLKLIQMEEAANGNGH